MLCTQAEDHVSYSCFFRFTLLSLSPVMGSHRPSKETVFHEVCVDG